MCLMKKFMKSFALLTVAALGLSACNDDKLVPDNGNADGKFVTVHFGAEAAIEGATKATLTPDEGETAFQAAWENEDKIAVKYTYVDDVIYETVPGTWDASASKFSAKLTDLTTGDEALEMKYQASYPYSETGYVDFGSARTQNGNVYNSVYDLMVAEPVTVTAKPGVDELGNAIVFPMQRQTAITYFHFTSENTEAITKATLKVEGEGAAIAAETVLLDPTGMDYETGLSEIVLTTTGQTADDFTLWFNVLPTTYTKMTLIVETATKTFTISNTKGGSYTAGKLYKVKKENISWTSEGGSDTPSTVTDVITADKLAATSTSYTDFSNKSFTSSAIYAGNSAKNASGHIQLRSKNSNSGIVTTTSGGKVKKVSIVWSSSNTQDRTLDIYGKNTPYASAANLYATENAVQGTKLGALNSTNKDTELIISGDYAYVGVRSNADALIIESISITWESGSSEPAPDTHSVSCATVTGGTLSASPAKAETGAEVTLTATPDKGDEFNNDWTVSNAETSEAITVTGGKFTMPAADVNVTASFKQLSYAITANPAENGTYIVKVGGEEVSSAVYGAKVLLEATPAEGYICDGWTVVDTESNPVYVSNNSFTMPASAVTISTSFSLKPVDITYDHAGTAEDPYSVADVLKYISTLGTATSESEVYAKGVISSITEVSTKFGNATYKIKDEGIENEVKVFRGLYLDGAKFTSEDQIGVGDVVVVAGKVLDYNGTPEVNSGNKIVSIIKAPYLKATASKETGISAAGETVTITVDTNVDSWTATSDNADFAVGTPSGNTVDVAVSKNTDASERTATITVTAGTLSETITLTQKGASTGGDPTEQTIFLETFGSTTSTPAFNEYTGYSATAEMFTTSGDVNTHYSGSGKIGKNNLKGVNLSSEYTGASGFSGCYHTGTANTEATILQISDINITDCVNISVSFGALGGSSSHKVSVYYTIDGGAETALITDGAITNAKWTLLNANILGTGKSLTLIFKHTPTKAWTIRMDDIKVVGTK